LDYVLQNKTTDGIDLIPEIKIMKDKINSGNISEEILTNASAIKMQDNYSEIIKQVVIDDLLSNIIIYDDGSFIIVSGETSAKVLNSESEVYPISITSNKIWEQTYYGLGNQDFLLRYRVYAPYLVKDLQLKTYFNVQMDLITISSTSTANTATYYPVVLNSANSWISQNNSSTVKSKGEYFMTDYVGGIPVYSYKSNLETVIIKGIHDSYTIRGYFW